MKTLIEKYRIYPGEHCGSASMRGLLEHYCGLELPEPAVFGLGAGVECVLLRSESMDPKINVFGRTLSLETDIANFLGIDYREQPEDDDDDAWLKAREEVLAGRPTMLSGDILYLDYREYKVHFPGHRFVMLGFDDAIEKAFIADRIRDVPEACSYAALKQSRNPPEGLSTHNLWGRFHGTEVGNSLVDAARSAIAACAKRMLGAGSGGAEGSADESGMEGFAMGDAVQASTGVAAIRDLARELPSWGERDDATWIASFNGRSIEKFGNGGGNFRRLYAGFLEWARSLDPNLVPETAPGLALRAADGWTAVAACLEVASGEGAPASAWKDAADRAGEIAEVEQELFQRLADGVA
jgi:hypothetical protein